MIERLRDAIQAIVRETFPTYDFHALYRYRVVEMIDARVALQVVSRTKGLPRDLILSAWPGVAGASEDLSQGAIVLVAFVEGDPAQPFVAFRSSPEDASFVPVRVDLDATSEVVVGDSARFVYVGHAADARPLARAQGVQAALDSLKTTVNALVAVVNPLIAPAVIDPVGAVDADATEKARAA